MRKTVKSDRLLAVTKCALYRARPEPRYRDTALEALRYERRWFDPMQRNWPDFRTMPGQPPGPPTFPVAWCHGATGIGIARLRLRHLMPDDPAILPEIDAAIASVAASLNMPMTPASDFTPCHGASASGEFMLMIAEEFNRPEARAAAEQVGQVGLQIFHQPRMPWTSGLPDCGESPSLMIGTAGIGHFYLRLHSPSTMPSVLLPVAT